jgi:hypothetical protein
MPIYLGDTEIRPLYLGDQEICKVYLGDVLIYDCEEDEVNPENQPATIGDVDVYVANGVETPIDLAFFRDRSAPPYNDPENDLIAKVEVYDFDPFGTNTGTFLLNGVAINTATIFTREQLTDPNLNFVHYGKPGSSNTDVFAFRVMDAGSGKWSE